MSPSAGPHARLAEPVPVAALLGMFLAAPVIPPAPHHLAVRDGRLVEAMPCWRLRRLVRSMRELGPVRPVVVATDEGRARTMVAGRHPLPQLIEGRYRLAAALELGLEALPAVALGRGGHRRPSEDQMLAGLVARG